MDRLPAHRPRTGAYLLETITTGLYKNPLYCVREFVQNAYDSIRSSRRCGKLAPSQGRVKIVQDQVNRTLIIEDDGLGLGPEEAVVKLVDLGTSTKGDSVDNAGFRGIGRIAAVSYCDELSFETSNGNGQRTIIRFDATTMRRQTQLSGSDLTVSQVVKNCYSASVRPSEREESYFRVCIKGIRSNLPFLDEERLVKFLQLVAPVAMNDLEWGFSGKIHQLATAVQQDSSLETMQIGLYDVEGNFLKAVRRPYQDQFTANPMGKAWTVRVEDVSPLHPIDNLDRGWWGWIAEHERKGMLRVGFQGLSVRSHNIQMGEADFTTPYFKLHNLSRWCFGEIHIIDPSVRPNAQRDGFEDTKAWRAIKSEVKQAIASLEKAIRRESKERNRKKRRRRTARKRRQRGSTASRATTANTKLTRRTSSDQGSQNQKATHPNHHVDQSARPSPSSTQASDLAPSTIRTTTDNQSKDSSASADGASQEAVRRRHQGNEHMGPGTRAGREIIVIDLQKFQSKLTQYFSRGQVTEITRALDESRVTLG